MTDISINAAPPHPVRGNQKHLGYALMVISAAQLMVVLDATIVNIALPAIQKDLNFSPSNLDWVINAYALAFGGLLLLGGRSGDLFGRKRMFIVGISLFILSSFAGGLAQDQTWLIIARAFQGIGGAIASPTALALITSNFPEGKSRNKAMGVYAAMSGAGSAFGLLMGGILTDIASWRWVLFVNVPIGALVLAVAPFVLSESESRSGKMDIPGALSVSGGMTLLVYGLSHAASTSWTSKGTLIPLILSVAFLALFLFIETKSEHALMPLRIFANRNRSGSYAMMLTIGAAMFGMFFFLTQFIQDIMGYSPIKAGVAFLPVTVTIGVVAGITSQLVGKIGPRIPMTLGPIVGSIGLVWISFINANANYFDIIGPMMTVAAGMGLTFVPLTLTAVSKVELKEAGLASALLNTTQQIGGSLGLSILVTISIATSKAKVASMGIPASVGFNPANLGQLPLKARMIAYEVITSGYVAAFKVASYIAMAAVVIVLVVIRIKKEDIAAKKIEISD